MILPISKHGCSSTKPLHGFLSDDSRFLIERGGGRRGSRDARDFNNSNGDDPRARSASIVPPRLFSLSIRSFSVDLEIACEHGFPRRTVGQKMDRDVAELFIGSIGLVLFGYGLVASPAFVVVIVDGLRFLHLEAIL
jgi:hypothetical protein